MIFNFTLFKGTGILAEIGPFGIFLHERLFFQHLVLFLNIGDFYLLFWYFFILF